MSVVDYQEKLRTKSCALFLKLRFWIPPCAKPAGREERQRDKAARLLPAEETRQKRERAHKTSVSPQTAPFAQSGSQARLRGEAQPHPARAAGPAHQQQERHEGEQAAEPCSAATQREEPEARPAGTATPLWHEPALPGWQLCSYHRSDPQLTTLLRETSTYSQKPVPSFSYPPPAITSIPPPHTSPRQKMRTLSVPSSHNTPRQQLPLLTQGQGAGVGHSNFMSSTSKIRVAFGGMIPGWPVEP